MIEREVSLTASAWVECGAHAVGMVGQEWLATAREELPDRIWDRALAGQGVPAGVPGLVPMPIPKAQLHEHRSGRYVTKKVTDQTLQRAWRQFGNEVDEVAISFNEITPDGNENYIASGFGVWLIDDLPEFIEVDADAIHPERPNAFQISEEWLVRSLARFVAARPVQFAAITPTRPVGIENGQPFSPTQMLLAAGHVLRGYEWVTVMAATLAAQLGGVAGLQASGAFWAVREVAGGAVWVQATERFADYGRAEVEAVFEALRPVLPDRELKPVRLNPSPWVLFDRRGLLPDPGVVLNPQPLPGFRAH